MLYLRNLFKYIKKNPLLTLSFFAISLGLFSSVMWQKNIKEFCNKNLFPIEGKYFHLVIRGNKDYSFLKEKIEDLPGISSVDIVDSSTIGDKTKSIIEELDLEMPKEMNKFTYTGMTVFMEQDLGEKNLNLLKEYLGRIVGRDNLTTSSTSVNPKAKKESAMMQVFKQAPHMILTLILLIIWNLLFLNILSSYKKFSSLIEKFQRKQGQTYWGICLLLFSPFVAMSIFGLWIGKINLVESALIFSALLLVNYLSSRKVRWVK